ncbi:MAG: glycosyltransferase, partial [Planctomycetota bacterium]
MRVLHLLHSLRRGGLERVVASVANGLQRRGLTQGLCCLHEAGPLIGALDPRIETFVLGAAPNDVTLASRLGCVYRRFRPEVIHTVDFCSWPDATLASLSQPRVRRMHSFHGFLADPPRRWRLAGRCLARWTHLLHAVSDDLADRAARIYRISRRRIEVIPNGVDVGLFDPALVQATKAERWIPEDRFVCITVGSLTPAKNPLLLLEVARRVGSGVHFVWVGDGPLRGELAKQLADSGLTDTFTLAGPVDDVRPWLAAAD